MNISQFIRYKKEAIRNKLDTMADTKMMAEMAEIEKLKKERDDREKREFVRMQLREEKEVIKKLKYARLKDNIKKLSKGLKEIKRRSEERENSGQGIYSK